MGVQLRKSYVARNAVNNQIRRMIELFVDTKGRNPTAKEKRRIELEIIKGAERINRDRGGDGT